MTANLDPVLAQLAASIAGSPQALALLDALLAEGYDEASAIAFVAAETMPHLGADPSMTGIGSGRVTPSRAPAPGDDPAAPFGPIIATG